MTGHMALTGSLSEMSGLKEHKIYRQINFSFPPDRNGHVGQSDTPTYTLGLGRLKCSEMV